MVAEEEGLGLAAEAEPIQPPRQYLLLFLLHMQLAQVAALAQPVETRALEHLPSVEAEY